MKFPAVQVLLVLPQTPLIIVANPAETFLFAFITIEHVPVPVQAPDQPTNTEPVFGTAVSVIFVPGFKRVRIEE